MHYISQLKSKLLKNIQICVLLNWMASCTKGITLYSRIICLCSLSKACHKADSNKIMINYKRKNIWMYLPLFNINTFLKWVSLWWVDSFNLYLCSCCMEIFNSINVSPFILKHFLLVFLRWSYVKNKLGVTKEKVL